MTPDELKQHPSYPELLAADGHNLLGRLAALEQQVRDLQAQLASHEAAPYPHVRYDVQAIEQFALDSVYTPDYDPTAQMDTPITDDAQADACEALARGTILDAGLTDAQRERIWRNVKAALNGDGDHAA